MVLMTNIKKSNGKISFIGYPEGNPAKPFRMVFDENDYDDFQLNVPLDVYAAMAHYKLWKILQKGDTLPERETSYWY